MPKQVGAAILILKETRSKDTLPLFNRLGNCISYQDTPHYIITMTAITEEQISQDGFFCAIKFEARSFYPLRY